MSKESSGLFTGTKGYYYDFVQQLEKEYFPQEIDSTSIVWEHILSTQENYDGTIIPHSFEIDVPKTPETPNSKLWTHGNATEHMYEAVTSLNTHAPSIINSNPNIYSQFILYDYYKSLEKTVNNGFEYGNITKSGNWEFIIVKARQGQKYPVVKHALFTGFKE